MSGGMRLEAEAQVRQRKNGSQMRGVCPHLGLPDDPDTTFGFPAPANYCYWAQPPAAVEPNYQGIYCLTELHRSCAIYQEKEKVGPSYAGPWLEGRRPGLATFDRRQVLTIVAPAVALLFIVGLILVLRPSPGVPAAGGEGNGPGLWQPPEGNSDGSLPLVSGDGATATATATEASGSVSGEQAKPGAGRARETPTPTTALPRSPVGSESPSAEAPSPTPSPTRMATAVPCGPPAGWVTYVVRPGETLFRIALRYGLGTNVLQRANCLGTTSIYAGQVLYVPYVAPQSTATEPPTATMVPATATSESASEPPATAEPLPTATPVPPTATDVPPTATPPQPSPSPEPPSPTPEPTETATPVLPTVKSRSPKAGE